MNTGILMKLVSRSTRDSDDIAKVTVSSKVKVTQGRPQQFCETPKPLKGFEPNLA